jgi:hypothetical protein
VNALKSALSQHHRLRIKGYVIRGESLRKTLPPPHASVASGASTETKKRHDGRRRTPTLDQALQLANARSADFMENSLRTSAPAADTP